MNQLVAEAHGQHFTLADLEKMAETVAGSGLFGVKTKQQAFALMILAQAEGIHPAIAARDYNIIDGKTALRADAMLARFQAAGGKIKWHTLTDVRACATLSHAPTDGLLKLDWTMKMARRAGLADNEYWVRYPRAMLRSRVISEGIRGVYPAVIVGVYTVDELRDGSAGVVDVAACDASPAADPRTILLPAPEISAADFSAHILNIHAAQSLELLKAEHGAAYRAAHATGDKKALNAFEAARRIARARLEAGA